MYSLVGILKEEILFFIEKKKAYHFQMITNYFERMIFLIGMILLLSTKDSTLTCKYILKAMFWFVLVNSFLEISQRIESEIRLKQFDRCFNLRTSYWMVLFMRIIPVFIDSLFIALLSTIVVCSFVKVSFDLSFFNACLYILMMIFQYVVLVYLFSFIGIYFQRVQAAMGLIESYTFFYSGIVITAQGYSLSVFEIINSISESEYYLFSILIPFMCLEIFIVFIGAKCIARHVKK